MSGSKRIRGRGEGTIIKRADGRWAAIVSVGNGNRKWFYGKTRGEVSRKLTATLKSVQDGIAPPPERQTLADFATQWLGSIRPSLKPSTHMRYELDLRRHILPALGRLKLTQVTPQVVQKLYTAKEQEGLSSTTVHHTHVVLQRVLGQALKWGLVSRNAAALTDPPKPAKREMEILNAEQVRQLLDQTAEDRLGALYTLAVFTGIREGELFALQWSDIDLGYKWSDIDMDSGRGKISPENGMVHIRRTLRANAKGFEFGSPKTEKSMRKVAIGSSVTKALLKHRTMQSAEAIPLGSAWDQSELVFTNSVGGHLRPQNFLRRDFRPVLVRAELPEITFHQLRHTAASLALAQGVPVADVSAMLGHAGPHITLKIYAHILPGSERKTAAAMEDAING